MITRFRLVFFVGAVSACAAGRGAAVGNGAKYPPRPPTCELTLVHAPTPGVMAWDDLGPVEVTCHLDVGLQGCLRLFRAEACRMGGDLVYAFPERPLRPREQAFLYRGRVAHIRRAQARAPAAPAAAGGDVPTVPPAIRAPAPGHGAPDGGAPNQQVPIPEPIPDSPREPLVPYGTPT